VHGIRNGRSSGDVGGYQGFGFGLDLLEVGGAVEGFGVDLVDVFGAADGWPIHDGFIVMRGVKAKRGRGEDRSLCLPR
jgi:hypothetical protein